ncbi:hypothetical protein K0M31_013574 [Melipona bicolor]|uniref:Uncharacterized protein n=1 Tax=Melipona bicolor TaxID=60889 RepID=A0AA40FHH1_9HYME|nr:hypothetical protein K0M31_013574 [Melipona bicolor]
MAKTNRTGNFKNSLRAQCKGKISIFKIVIDLIIKKLFSDGKTSLRVSVAIMNDRVSLSPEVALRVYKMPKFFLLPLDSWKVVPAPGSPGTATRAVQRWGVHLSATSSIGFALDASQLVLRISK